MDSLPEMVVLRRELAEDSAKLLPLLIKDPTPQQISMFNFAMCHACTLTGLAYSDYLNRLEREQQQAARTRNINSTKE